MGVWVWLDGGRITPQPLHPVDVFPSCVEHGRGKDTPRRCRDLLITYNQGLRLNGLKETEEATSNLVVIDLKALLQLVAGAGRAHGDLTMSLMIGPADIKSLYWAEKRKK